MSTEEVKWEDEDVVESDSEAVWRIRSAEDEAYLARAIAAGLREVRRIDRLGLVLVAGSTEALRAWSNAELDAGLNVPLALPSIPVGAQLGAGLPLGDKLLDFFGLADRPASWGEGVRVAILDTGVSAHPSLDASKITLMEFGDSGTGVDANGHGTAVASLVVGNDSLAQGLAPSADLLVYQVLDEQGVGDAFGIASAIVSAVDAGAQVISLSAGSPTGATVLREAVSYAAERDVVIVAAAGNEGVSQALFPAAYADVLAVGAVDGLGRIAGFSNGDEALDLAAPGVGVYSAYADGRYVEFSGTSAATPIVASALAAILSEEPIMSATQAAAALSSFADDAGAPGLDSRTGAGIINPRRVLERNDPNRSDLGVSAPYLDPDASTETTELISINVQNRGNQYISAGQALVSVDGQAQVFAVAGLETGASVPIEIGISASDLRRETGVLFSVELSVGAGQSDDESANNGYELFLKFDSGE